MRMAVSVITSSRTETARGVNLPAVTLRIAVCCGGSIPCDRSIATQPVEFGLGHAALPDAGVGQIDRRRWHRAATHHDAPGLSNVEMRGSHSIDLFASPSMA